MVLDKLPSEVRKAGGVARTASIKIIEEEKPEKLYLTHFGAHQNIKAHFDELRKNLNLWFNWIKENNLKYHLDGARIWNAMIATKTSPAFYGEHFDTISVCFSKGLGAPIGSALIGSKEIIDQALRVRKILGGGMRQAGYLAEAASYAIDHHWQETAQDHVKARELGAAVMAIEGVRYLAPVDTNIVIFELVSSQLEEEFKNVVEVPAIEGRLKYLKKYLDGTRSRDNKMYTKSVLLFSLFIEHVSLFSQFLIMMSFNKEKNVLKGISNVVEATSKEEEIHGNFGAELINIIKEENPEWFDKEFEDLIHSACTKAYHAECRILDWIFEKGELSFLSLIHI